MSHSFASVWLSLPFSALPASAWTLPSTGCCFGFVWCLALWVRGCCRQYYNTSININIYWLTGCAIQRGELFCLLCGKNRRPDALSASWSLLWWIMVYSLLLLPASYIHGLWKDLIMCLEILANIGHILKMEYLNYALKELWFVRNRNPAIVYTPSMKF